MVSCPTVDDWHPVAFADALDTARPLGAELLGEELVVWRDGAGTVHAWRDRCVHRGSRLSLGRVVDGARLQCPYHGWQYDAGGRCVHIPAQPGLAPERAKATRYRAQTRYGLVWVCLGDQPRHIAPFPEWDDDSFRKIPCGPYPVATSGQRVIENFLDVAHFPFVHQDILGVAEQAEIDDYRVTVDDNGVEASDVRVYQPDPYGTGQGDTVSYLYRAGRPLSAYLRKRSAGPQFAILLAVAPHGEEHSSAYMWMAMNYAHELPAAQLIDWQDAIFAQDRPVLESQRPRRLPLDPDAELSVRCDRTAVMYRRWLKASGVRFGVEV